MKNQTDRWTTEQGPREGVRGQGSRYEVGERTLAMKSDVRRRGRIRPLSESTGPEELNCSMIGGGAMMLWGLLRGNLGGMVHAALGGLLMYRGMHRQCPLCGGAEGGRHRSRSGPHVYQPPKARED